jgi:4-hydroxy-tetrahydrodipicolinate synthase
VLAPVVTPFTKDLRPDPGRFIAHCRWLLGQNCGLAVFGTNSEANSLAVDERLALLEALLEAGLEPARLMPGTGCCALTDTVRLTAHAVKAGCAGVLMLPPFYYKEVSEDGLFRYFAEVIERVGEARLRIYLYHIPPVAVVGFTVPLIARLLHHYPGVIAGMKDSSGDWAFTQRLLEAFAGSGFDVFPGSETFLLTGLRHGAAGCISATANVNPAAIDRLYRRWQSPDAEQQQAALNAVRQTVGQHVMIPGLKYVIAHYADDPAWVTVRPPLTELTPAQGERVIAGLQRLGFAMPGIGLATAPPRG